MSISWAHAHPSDLRAHHARDAVERAGELPSDVTETQLAPAAAFRGGLLFTPPDCVKGTIIVYFHGGGFLAGSPETHRCVTAWLAKLSGMRVLSARYGLAPEQIYPAQQEDALAACEMACTLSGGDMDRTQLFLAGDSAGACVALWAWRGFAPRQRRNVKGFVLLYGGFGHIEGDSIAKYGTPKNGLDSETLSIMYQRLGIGAADGIWPKDFAGEITAPTYILAAALDAVFDDSAKLFQSLPENATNKTFVVVQGQDHGFFKGTGKDPVALQELTNAARWIARIAGSKA